MRSGSSRDDFQRRPGETSASNSTSCVRVHIPSTCFGRQKFAINCSEKKTDATGQAYLRIMVTTKIEKF